MVNRIRPKINYLLGVEKRGRQDPKAFPRTPGHQQDAEAATDAIRYVCDDQDFPDIASDVWEHMIVEGFGGVEVAAEAAPGGGGTEVRIVLRHWPWDRLFYDPHARRRDFADAKYLGGVVWMDEDEVLARWPAAGEAVRATYAQWSSGGETYEDRPRHLAWADARRRRVRVVQLWWRSRRTWMTATFTAGGFLAAPQDSPYLDEDGRPECPLILQSAYVDRDNRRYGVVRDMIGPQDEINVRRRKALHLLSVRQVIAEEGAVRDVDQARQELAKPDGYVEVAPSFRFEISPTGDLAAGQAQLLQEAKAELEALGPNAFLQGRQGAAASGRAIALSQQGGAIEIDGAVLDQHRRWKRRVYRAIWNRVRQVWTAEKWIRVTDDQRNVRFVALNRPETLGDALLALPAEQRAAALAARGLVPGDPRLAAPTGRVLNDVARMTVDIVVDEAPDVVSLQIEQFQQLVELGRAGLPIPPRALIEASGVRNKQRILDALDGRTAPDGAPPVPPGPPPELQVAAMRLDSEATLARERMRSEAEVEIVKARIAAEAEITRARVAAEADLAVAQLRSPPMPPPAPAADLASATRDLRAAIRLHRLHMDGAAPTTGPDGERSQMTMMRQMQRALAAIGGAGPAMDGTMDMGGGPSG